MRKDWKNRIGPTTIEKDLTLDDFSEVTHLLVAPFVKLYVEVTNFATYMIISHRNLLSVFDLAAKNWVDTVKLLEDSEDHIRNM